MATQENNRSEIYLIKDKLDIVDVIGQTINLSDNGNGIFKGAISSGSKSGTSLHVDRNLQVYHDFASGAGGDVLNWIANYNNYDIKTDFPSVLKIAAEIAGIELDAGPGFSEAYEHKNYLETLTTVIAEHYHNCLLPEHRKKITEQWGISDEMINRLHIGFAPRGNQLIETFKDLFPEDMLYETGLILKFDGSHKDLFNGRIVFPYWKNGKVLYFIGRQTKWTPDNKFEKSKYIKQLVHNEKHLYVSEHISNQYFYGEDTIRGADNILITEGVTDCIMAMQVGIPCISPVTINIKKVELERAYKLINGADRVVVCNDNDDSEAGKDGAITTAEFLVTKGVDVRLVELPKGVESDKIDLAEYLRDNSKKEYILLAEAAKTLYRVRLEKVAVDKDPSVAIDAAIGFIDTELKDQSKAYQNTFIDKHLKEHFKLTVSQIKDIKSTISKKNKNSSKSVKVPLSQDRIEEDAIHNRGVDIPIPYCLETAQGETGTFRHSMIQDPQTGDEKDVFDVICYNPTWLSGAFVDPETSQHYMELSFEYRDNTIERMVSQSDVLTTTGLKNLTKYGLNVPESKTKHLADFFATFIKKSSTLKEKPIFSRYGWIDDFFVYGNKIINKNTVSRAHLVNNIEPENIEPLECNGNVDGWIDATKGMLQYDNVRFVCYAAVTALVLKPLNGASFVMEQLGDTSKGKTITAQLAMSIFGNPVMLKMSTSVTKVFVERQCALYNNLPQFLDETSLIPLDVLKEITYMISNETSKGRGKKEGGIEKVQRWKTVLLTTGESPLINMGSLGGQDVRTISLYGGVGAHDSTNVEYFKERMTDNYAVIGPLLVQKIINERDNLYEYYTNIRNKLKTLGKSDVTGTMGRLVDTYSLIAIAGFVFESVMEDLGEHPQDAGALVEQIFCDRLTQSDGSLEERALSIVHDWVIENKKCFCENKEGEAGTKYALYGNISMEWPANGIPFDYVDIIPQRLKEVLDKKLGHPGISTRILKDWAISDKIVLDKEGKGRILSTLKTGLKQSRVVRLKLPLDIELSE